jgi:hypothetical protein
MTELQARRADAKVVEASRQDAYHNGTDTVVVGLRMSVELRDALIEAKDSSNGEFGGGALSPYIVNQLVESVLRTR